MCLKHDNIPDWKKNHHLQGRGSLVIMKYVQAEINTHTMVFCEAESLHHVRNGYGDYLKAKI